MLRGTLLAASFMIAMTLYLPVAIWRDSVDASRKYRTK